MHKRFLSLSEQINSCTYNISEKIYHLNVIQFNKHNLIMPIRSYKYTKNIYIFGILLIVTLIISTVL